ncbi:hypothetical protein ACFWFF_04480 [Streptomyces sp. NPDC060223]|uniref:hypothetical protein n=1 Tax=unclassified Streptomyces TaxID=2593676 RepID=UPI003640A1A5
MTRIAFDNCAFLWGWWTAYEAVWIVALWQSRSRVLGKVVCRLPGVRRIWRTACEKRVETLLDALEGKGVPADGRPDRSHLVDRWHRIVAGRCVSVLLQAVPLLVAVLPFGWLRSFAPTVSTPLWMGAAVAGMGLVSLALMAADLRAVAVSDAAGTVTEDAVGFLELLLLPDGRRPQDSALDVHARAHARLCQALRAQARHTTRRMPSATRARVRGTTERLIAALADADQRYLLGEGPDRDTAVRDLSRLVASALSHSCVPRSERTSLVIVDAALLTRAPETDAGAGVAEPLRSRLLAGAGRLAVAVGLLGGAFVFRGEGLASELLVLTGVMSAATVFRPLMDALLRAADLRRVSSSGGETAELPTGDTEPLAPDEPELCPHCASDRSPVTAGSRPVR